MKAIIVLVFQKRIMKALRGGQKELSELRQICNASEHPMGFAVAVHDLIRQRKIFATRDSNGVYQSFSITDIINN